MGKVSRSFPIHLLICFRSTNHNIVCLSLLGTWEGQKWVPNESTILQILISIQAMIFCENPIHNEPGMSSQGINAQGQQYVKALYPLTARFAILDWATNPPALWRDEAAYHFKKNGDKILRTVEQWTRRSRDAGPSDVAEELLYGPYNRDLAAVDLAVELPKLQKALQRYGATYVPKIFEPVRAQNNSYGGRYSGGRGSPYGGGGMFGGGYGSQFGGGFR
jgi:uncharacterized membrane protein YgcG